MERASASVSALSSAAGHVLVVNPAGPPSRGEIYLFKAVARIAGAGLTARQRLDAASRPALINIAAIARLGLDDLKRSLLGGQYHHPRGLFYGGEIAEESTRWLQARRLPPDSPRRPGRKRQAAMTRCG